MRYIHMAAYILVIVGALNWGLLALTGYDVGSLFGGMDAAVSRIIYVLVAVAGVYIIATHRTYCTHCNAQAKI